MPGESLAQGHGKTAKVDQGNPAFVSDDSDVARIFMQVTGTDISPELLDRLARTNRPGGQVTDASAPGGTT